MHTLTRYYLDTSAHTVRFTAIAQWRWLARIYANRQRRNWLRSRNLPNSFLTYVNEEWV